MKWKLVIILILWKSHGFIIAQGRLMNEDSSIMHTSKIVDKKLYRKWSKLVKQGYLFSSIDSQYQPMDSTSIWQLKSFKRYDSLFLRVIIDSNQKEEYGFKGYSFQKVQLKLDELINHYIRSGYLKSTYQFDTILAKNENIIISYRLKLGRRYVVDSFLIHQTSTYANWQFLNKYIHRYLRSSGNFDWQELVEQLRYFDFIEMEKLPDFTVLDSTAILNIYVKERKLNQANAILGFLPNAYNTSQLEITGDVKLGFINLFKKGVSLDINWQKNLNNSQFLYTRLTVPYILNTKLGLGGSFNLEKFDTSYIRLYYHFGLNYNIHYNQVLSFNYKRNSSTIIGLDQQAILNGILPSYLDYNTDEFGIGYRISKLNRPIFPRKGWTIDANFSAGNKTTAVNSRISELKDLNGQSMAKLYDSIPLSQFAFSISIDLNKYVSLGKSFVLNTRLNAKGWFSETISIGEMQYLGGTKMLRGFDDNSFIVPWYACISNELQYYLSEYFYSNIFVDIAPMKSQVTSLVVLPIGFGAGLSFKSGDNIFRMNLGTGYQGESNFSLSAIKVHLNYINVF